MRIFVSKTANVELKAENAELRANVDSWKWLYGKAEAENPLAEGLVGLWLMNEESQVLNVAYEKQVGEHIALRASLCNEIAELKANLETAREWGRAASDSNKGLRDKIKELEAHPPCVLHVDYAAGYVRGLELTIEGLRKASDAQDVEIAELEDRVENQHSIFLSDQKKMNQARLILGGV